MSQKSLLLRLCIACNLLFSQYVHAEIVSVGFLTRDTSQGLISDSLNQRVWSGWDTTRNFTYEQATAATGLGGAFEGFRLAGALDAQLFANAMVGGGNLCSIGGDAICGTVSVDAEVVVGESFLDSRSLGETYDDDFVFFLSDNGVGFDVGLLGIMTNDNLRVAELYKTSEWGDFDAAQFYNDPAFSVGWLLYRDVSVNSVSEPSPLALLMLGLLCMGMLRVRRLDGRPHSDLRRLAK